jgi:hypothetical protein
MPGVGPHTQVTFISPSPIKPTFRREIRCLYFDFLVGLPSNTELGSAMRLNLNFAELNSIVCKVLGFHDGDYEELPSFGT